MYLALEVVSKSECKLVVLSVYCCHPLGLVGVAWPGLGDGCGWWAATHDGRGGRKDRFCQ